MRERRAQIDLVKLALYILKRCWLVVICAAIGFGAMYWRSMRTADTYTASGTMYVYNANPNLVNYGYTNTSDLASAVRLVDTYAQVVKSNRVLDAIVERMSTDHPGITNGRVAGSLSMTSVSETGVVRVSSRTTDPVLSADIVNTVLDVAPAEIKRVVGAGDIEVIDYATAPGRPDGRQDMRRGLTGALAGAAAAAALLALLFLLNSRIADTKELTDNYTLPVLASVKRRKEEDADPGAFVLTDKSPMEMVESYAKLRMNLLYTLVEKESRSVAVVSAISGEGKSTIAANLAISLSMSGKKVLLIDADLRRACQQDLFYYNKHLTGLSEALVGMTKWQHSVIKTKYENLEILPTGHRPPNPSELLESDRMREILKEMEAAYDLVLLDAPPINIVSDPLALSDRVAGAIFVVRQNFSDHREVRRALKAAEMTGMNLLGFVFYGENVKQGSYYYNRRYYKSYYHKYDNREKTHDDGPRNAGTNAPTGGGNGSQLNGTQAANPTAKVEQGSSGNNEPQRQGTQANAAAKAEQAGSGNNEPQRQETKPADVTARAEQATGGAQGAAQSVSQRTGSHRRINKESEQGSHPKG